MKKIFIVTIIMASLILVSCTSNNKAEIDRISTKPVKTISINEESRQESLEYVGIVISEETRNIGFKSSGKLQSIYVTKGSKITKGTEIARLETKELQLMLNASKAQLDAAKAQYDKAINGATVEDKENARLNLKKAEDAYTFTKDSFDKVQKLYGEGAASKQDLDKVKLELEVREAEYNQASQLYKQVINGAREEDKRALEAQWEQAKTDYEYKKNLLEDATIISDTDGYVIDVLYKEGELVPQGYPVVVVRNENKVVRVGLPHDDIYKVNQGDKAIVDIDGNEVEGTVVSIGEVPDQQTRTYEVKIVLDSKQYKIGAIAKVRILAGEEKGIWIPITSVITSGDDYVFIVNEGKTEKKKVVLGDIDRDEVRVEGLENGERLVIENIRNINAGDKVTDVDDIKR